MSTILSLIFSLYREDSFVPDILVMEDNFDKTKFSPAANISNSPQHWDNSEKTRDWDIHRSGNVMPSNKELNVEVANPKSKTRQVSRQRKRKEEKKGRQNIRMDIAELESYYDDYFDEILRQL